MGTRLCTTMGGVPFPRKCWVFRSGPSRRKAKVVLCQDACAWLGQDRLPEGRGMRFSERSGRLNLPVKCQVWRLLKKLGKDVLLSSKLGK